MFHSDTLHHIAAHLQLSLDILVERVTRQLLKVRAFVVVLVLIKTHAQYLDDLIEWPANIAEEERK